MKFGVFYEHQVPKPWVGGDERRVFQEALEQAEFRTVADDCRAAAVACARAGLADWTPRDALDWAAPAVVGYELEAVLTWLEFGRPADDARFVRATRASLAAGVRAWAADEHAHRATMRDRDERSGDGVAG